MPTEEFARLFHSWGDNEQLTLKQLYLKAIKLVALVFMTRPSGLTPKATVFDTKTMSVRTISLSVNNEAFGSDGS